MTRIRMTKRTRKKIPLKTLLASALLQLRDAGGMPLISYEHSKLMTADQICSLFNFDHYPIRKADGGPDEPWNLQPLLIKAHRIKTAKKDKPELSKQARLRGETCTGPRKQIPARQNPWPKQRKLRGRGFQKRAQREART